MIEITPKKSAVKIKTVVPTSKSYTNRALLLAALAKGTTTIKNPLYSDDTIVMIRALQQLGVKIKKTTNVIKVIGTEGTFKKSLKPLFFGNAGTAVRFMTAAMASQPFKTIITGDERMQRRPLSDLINALTKLGAKIHTVKNSGCPPLTIEKPFNKPTTKVKGDISSQYLSALLMISPYIAKLTKKSSQIGVIGKLTSKPYVEMTLDIMKTFGVKVENNNYKKFTTMPQTYRAINYTVEGDASSASYPLAIAALTAGEATINNINKSSKQADLQFLNILEKMGCKSTKNSKSIKISGTSKLKPLGTINLNELPDAAMTVAILCCFAKGKSKLTGLANLRVKESDRLSALTNELTKIGADIKEGKDFLAINGTAEKLHGATIETYDDHRIAMCFAVAGCVVNGIKISNPDCVNKTYPNFWKDLKKWGINTTISS